MTPGRVHDQSRMEEDEMSNCYSFINKLHLENMNNQVKELIMMSNEKLQSKEFEVETLKRDVDHRILKIRGLEDQLYQKEIITQETVLKQDLQNKIVKLREKLEE
jgi:hypothetical protein